MSIQDMAAAVLLIVGILGFALTSVGLLLTDDLYSQIHFLAPASLLGSLAIPAAILVHEGFSQMGSKAILIALLLFFSNPILSHTTARAARIRRKQKLAQNEGEVVKFSEEKA